MSSNYKNLSFYDLLQIPAFKLAAQQNCKETMDRVLWDCGMDTNQNYEIVWTTHRALTTNIPQENYMVFGWGRTDEEFLKSGHARIEDHIAASGDSSLRAELLGLNPQGSMIDSEYDATEHNLPEGELISFEEEDVVVDVINNEGDCV